MDGVKYSLICQYDTCPLFLTWIPSESEVETTSHQGRIYGRNIFSQTGNFTVQKARWTIYHPSLSFYLHVLTFDIRVFGKLGLAVTKSSAARS